MIKTLATLKKVDLREFWKHEALDFTQWLAQEPNIQLLSDEIGISLTDVRAEEAIGRFNVDLVATDEDSQKKVIIENQLECTDHKHLGQIITYAAGYNAGIVIWIVKDLREEHQKAIEWLNNSTVADLSFFLIRMELWQIGDSPYAPKFHVVEEPNDWAKQIQQNQQVTAALTDTKLTQLEFWQQFIAYAKENKTKLRVGRKAKAQHWYNISFGTSEAYIAISVNTKENRMGVEIYIPKAPHLYARFLQNRATIDANLNMQLEWMPLEDKIASRIKTESNADIDLEVQWKSYFNWLLTTAEQMAEQFGKYL